MTAVMVDASRSRPRVLARLAATSSTVLALGATGHVAGAGSLPDARATAAVALLTVVGAVPLARRRLRVATLLPAAAVWQWLVHHAFAATAPGLGHGAAHPGAAHLRTGHLHTGELPTGVLPGGHLESGVALVPGHGTTVAMLAAHAVATVLTVALLIATERGAERALDRCAWAVPVLTGAHPLPVVARHRPTPVLGAVAPTPPPARTRGAHGRRAPPPAVRAA